jgi:hypothetical protein
MGSVMADVASRKRRGLESITKSYAISNALSYIPPTSCELFGVISLRESTPARVISTQRPPSPSQRPFSSSRNPGMSQKLNSPGDVNRRCAVH